MDGFGHDDGVDDGKVPYVVDAVVLGDKRVKEKPDGGVDSVSRGGGAGRVWGRCNDAFRSWLQWGGRGKWCKWARGGFLNGSMDEREVEETGRRQQGGRETAL